MAGMGASEGQGDGVNMRAASPWDALLRPQQRRLMEPGAAPDARQPSTKVATLLALLAERDSATTLTLSVCADLTSRQVWGLLKAPLDFGQVHFADGRWSLSRSFAGRDIERAATLLRSKGWRVAPPRRHLDE